MILRPPRSTRTDTRFPYTTLFRSAGSRTLRAILITHHHADHSGGLNALRAHHQPVCYGPHDPRIDGIDVQVSDGDAVDLPEMGLHFGVYAVPGHTRSHIAYHGNGWLFCGDTLFSLGCGRSEEHTSELQSLMRNSYAVFCLKKKNTNT